MNLNKIKTVKELLQYGNSFLKENNIETHTKDSKELLGHILSLDNSQLLLEGNLVVNDEHKTKYIQFIYRRSKKEPLAYVINTAYFMELQLYVDENVLIPRFETEILVELINNYIHKSGYNNVLEIGTGSGCISLSIGYEFNSIHITAVDISQKALSIAKRNSIKNNISNIVFLESDIFSNIIDKKFDIIVSNPPYIETETINTLDDGVKDFEPHLALDGGKDGLDFYKNIIEDADRFLNKHGMIFFEIGYNQGLQVKKLLELNNFTNIEIMKDYARFDRIVFAIKE